MTLITPIILSQKIKILKTHPCNLLFLHLLLMLIKIIRLCFTSLFLHVLNESLRGHDFNK